MKVRKNKAKSNTNKYAANSTAGNLAASIFSGGSFLNLNRNLSAFNPNVRFLFILTVVAAALSAIYHLIIAKASVDSSMTLVVIDAAVFFFSYLIARELDPDRSIGAYLAGFLALGSVLFWGAGNIVVLFWMLMLLRLLNRSSGMPAGLFDNLLILIATYWIVRDGQWGYAALTAIIYAIESQLPNGSPRSLYAAGFAFLIAALSPKVPYVQSAIPSDIFMIMIVATILFLPVIKLSEHVRSIGDYGQQPLNTLRLQAAQIFAILAAFGMAWFYGESIIQSFLPIWGAILGVGIYLPVMLVMRIKN